MASLLITGGAGFFGRAYVQWVLLHNVFDRVCVYSRDEAKHAAMRTEFKNDERLRFFVGDVRDPGRLRFAMQGVETVIHAAALKRVEVGEYDPGEVVKTNIVGTLNVIETCLTTKVRRMIALSTDKACDPINAYGASKLMLEKLVLAANNQRGRNGCKFAVTRYGNVAGSTGSVIPTWRAMGFKVPVTHPDATRFWMTAKDAVQLVSNLWEYMKGGEMLIPILSAYRLGDLCVAMNKVPDVVGLRPGEKLHEALDHNITSDRAERLTVEQLRYMLASV